MATNFGKIGQNWKTTFTWQAGVVERVGIWQFQFKSFQWQYCSYVVCKYDQDRSSNPRDCVGNNCTFLDETAKIGIIHQISRQLLDQSEYDKVDGRDSDKILLSDKDQQLVLAVRDAPGAKSAAYSCLVMCCMQYSRSHLMNVEEFRAVVDTLIVWKVHSYALLP